MKIIVLVLLVAVAIVQAKNYEQFAKIGLEKFQKLGGHKAVSNFGNAFKKIFSFVSRYLGEHGQEKTNQKGDFCRGYECPTYNVKNATNVYELRCYQAANWVTTKGRGAPSIMGKPSRKMFEKLFDYIRGANNKKTEIKMTVPVLSSVTKATSLKMSFYIPQKFQMNPPKPTDPSVFIESKRFCAYVHSFSGYQVLYSQYEPHINKLKDALKRDGLQDSYEGDTVYIAGYDKPTRFLGRHTEVMFMKK